MVQTFRPSCFLWVRCLIDLPSRPTPSTPSKAMVCSSERVLCQDSWQHHQSPRWQSTKIGHSSMKLYISWVQQLILLPSCHWWRILYSSWMKSFFVTMIMSLTIDVAWWLNIQCKYIYICHIKLYYVFFKLFHLYFSVFQDLNSEESAELDIRVRQSLERRYKATYEAEKAAFLQHLK